jgi:hypothetical protein
VRLQLVVDGGPVAWEGCDFCLGRAIVRGQEETIRQLCKDAETKAQTAVNPAALY